MQTFKTATRGAMAATKFPSKFKSLIYSAHDAVDCTKILKIHNYTPKHTAQDSILLRTLAFPINPSDINQLQGVYPSRPEKVLDYSTEEPSAIAGNEGLFEVLSVPPSESGVSVGDWVIPLHANMGTWSNYRTCTQANELIKVNGLDKFTAATISVNGCTAYQLVNNYIDWDPKGNEWLVQNAGTSGVSKIVTQIAKARGVKTLSVIRDRDNFEEVAHELETRYGATKVISESQSSDREFSEKVLPTILGPDAKVRLALNSVGGKSSTSIARKLSNGGLMLTYGGMSKQPVTVPTTLHIFKGITLGGYWVTANTLKDPQSKVDTVKELLNLYKDGKLVSPEPNIKVLEWDTANASDEQILELVKKGMTDSGKNLVVLKW